MKLVAKTIHDIATQTILLDELSPQVLADFCQHANERYRQGEAIISDEDYDFLYLPALAKSQPNHPLLQSIEAENQGFSDKKYRLPQEMLSTDKAYTWTEVEKWLLRIEKVAKTLAIPSKDIVIEATAKLDGFAGFDDGQRFYTRGDGKKGSDISRVFARGLSVFENNPRGLGAGEIVVKKSYFLQKLAQYFDYPRNFQASIIKEKALDAPTQQAIDDKAAVFVPFSTLPRWRGGIEAFSAQFQEIISDCINGVDFDTDGVVLATTNQDICQNMGSTRKFHRWQLAFKENKDKAQVLVLDVIPQVGRTGKITPVVLLEPTLLSGATLSRASAHHYGYIRAQNLGVDSVVELTRSGLVIPKINQVLRSSQAIIPTTCPSCATKLVWQADFLLCPNQKTCPDQIISSLLFFFVTLGNNDGFGRATIEKLYTQGIENLVKIYQLTQTQLSEFGFGDKTSKNLLQQLQQSQNIAIEDWRFLAAFGVNRLGQGNCERLLQSYKLAEIFSLTEEEIVDIEGFAQLSANAMILGLQTIKSDFDLLVSNFDLETTPLLSENSSTNSGFFAQKSLVFTGKMQQSRTEMTKHAKSLGIKVLSSVTKQCDYLIIGENVGQSKLDKAKKLGVEVLDQRRYLEMVNQGV